MSAFMVIARGYNMYERLTPTIILESSSALYVPKARLLYALANKPSGRAGRYLSFNPQYIAVAYPTLDVLLAVDAIESRSSYGSWDCALRGPQRNNYRELGIPTDYLGTAYVRAVATSPAACCRALSAGMLLRLADIHKLCNGGISRANSRVPRDYAHKFTVEFFIACKYRSPNMWSIAGEASSAGNTDMVAYALETCSRIPPYGYPSMDAMTVYLLQAADNKNIDKLITKVCCKHMPSLEVLRDLPITRTVAREIIDHDYHVFYTPESEYLHGLARGE